MHLCVKLCVCMLRITKAVLAGLKVCSDVSCCVHSCFCETFGSTGISLTT
jgi:hypothetical protein